MAPAAMAACPANSTPGIAPGSPPHLDFADGRCAYPDMLRGAWNETLRYKSPTIITLPHFYQACLLRPSRVLVACMLHWGSHLRMCWLAADAGRHARSGWLHPGSYACTCVALLQYRAGSMLSAGRPCHSRDHGDGVCSRPSAPRLVLWRRALRGLHASGTRPCGRASMSAGVPEPYSQTPPASRAAQPCLCSSVCEKSLVLPSLKPHP